MQFVCFVIFCAVVFIIWYVFSWIVEINDVAKPKKNVFSGGEAGDVIIEKSDGIKEEIKKGYGIQGGLWAENPYIETVSGRDENNNVISNKLHLICNIKKQQYEETNGIDKNAIIPVKLYYYNGKDKNYIEKTTYINIDLSGYFEEPTENPILPSPGDETGDSSLDYSLDTSLDTVNI